MCSTGPKVAGPKGRRVTEPVPACVHWPFYPAFRRKLLNTKACTEKEFHFVNSAPRRGHLGSGSRSGRERVSRALVRSPGLQTPLTENRCGKKLLGDVSSLLATTICTFIPFHQKTYLHLHSARTIIYQLEGLFGQGPEEAALKACAAGDLALCSRPRSMHRRHRPQKHRGLTAQDPEGRATWL